MKLTTFLPLIMILLLCNTSYTQENSWVSVSNEYITISVDTVSGRYIVYNSTDNSPPTRSRKSFFPKKFLTPASPNNTTLSPILGEGTNALNVTTFNINGNPVVFGSSSGNWVTPPKVDDTSIDYTWRVGSLNIIQRLAIVTNLETLTPDAVEISYDVFNNYSGSQQIQARMVLDPVVNDGQENTFFLPNTHPIQKEHSSSLGTLPEYWLTTDRLGNISPFSLKGFVSDNHTIKPNYFYLTTIDRALADIWKFDIKRSNSLRKKDVAVVLMFEDNTIYPKTSKRIASTTVSMPTLMNTFQNNGLEVRTSSFVRQQTLPAYVTLWVQNASTDIFDSVELELQIPNSLRSYDILKQTISDVRGAVPVTWRLDTDAKVGDNYSILVLVKGYRNGALTSIFDVPLLINIDPTLANSANGLVSSIENLTVVTNRNGTVTLERLGATDTLGNTSDNLSKMQLRLSDSENLENAQLISIIELEQQLIREISEIDSSLNEVDKQYLILIEMYKRLYGDNLEADREQINIQGLIDNIKSIEDTLIQQEKMISNITSE